MEKPRIIEILGEGKNSSVSVNDPLFEAPGKIVFHKYEPFKEVKRRIKFRNKDTVNRRLIVSNPHSTNFSIERISKNAGKRTSSGTAPGMVDVYEVTFKPDEKRDYAEDLICITEREKFCIKLVAHGPTAILDLPECIEFMPSPVKTKATKSILLRNIGDKATTYELSASAPFEVKQPTNGEVHINSSVQVTLGFCPVEAREYIGVLTVSVGDGSVREVTLIAHAVELDVDLEQSIVNLGSTYITLKTRKTIKLLNNSDRPVSFDWKTFETLPEDIIEQNNMELELKERHSEEVAAICSNRDLVDADGMPENTNFALRSLERTFERHKNQIRKDKLLFSHENFEIVPTSGKVWPGQVQEINISFVPQNAIEYRQNAYLEIEGRQERVRLQMHGKGIGPAAAFSFETLDVKEIFIGSEHSYELLLENRGDIPAEYTIITDDMPRNAQFLFEPKTGILPVGAEQSIRAHFSSNILGDFCEVFKVQLTGSPEPLTLTFRGTIIGPTFHFEESSIDYGHVSFGFMNARNATLVNTSDIPLNYRLRIPQDGRFLQKEFDIIPAQGTVLPHGKQTIRLELVSACAREYDMFLSVDVVAVGEGLLSLPISATCRVPDVTLETSELQFGVCFLRHPYFQKLVLKNHSDLPARYEMVPQDEASIESASFECDMPKGIIEALSTKEINVTLVVETNGRIKLPLQIKMAGAEEGVPNLLSTVLAIGRGAHVVVSPERVSFGKTPCLKPATRSLQIKNDSLIPASFKMFAKKSRSRFSVDIREAVLSPGEEITATVTALLDDTLPHSDLLHILVQESDSLSIPIEAHGVGTTMHCEHDLSCIDFGYQFAGKHCERQFLLENKGRRAQVLNWVNATLVEQEQEKRRMGGRSTGPRGRGRKSSTEEVLEPVFTVSPESVELKPRTACLFTFRGNALKPKKYMEKLQCFSKIGTSQGKNPQLVFSCETIVEFVAPVLEPSLPQLSFSYQHDPAFNDIEDEPSSVIQKQPLTLKNVNVLPCTFVLRAHQPFSVEATEYHLSPNESVTVDVSFAPLYRADHQSHDVNSKLQIIYREHSRKDFITLNADIHFPNLKFEYSQLDFGSILNDTTKSMLVKVSNDGTLDCEYQWSFLEDVVQQRAVTTSKRPYIPVNQVFDILPIRGILKADETESIEFVFYGHANRKFSGIACCEVRGGPEYEVKLSGDASTVGYSLDRDLIDFDVIQFDAVEEKTFNIINTGKVAFNFNICTEHIKKAYKGGKPIFSVNPQCGRVFANSTQKVSVSFSPGIPKAFQDELLLELAHFPPVPIQLIGRGDFGHFSCSLPRVFADGEEERWNESLNEAKELLVEDLRKEDMMKTIVPMELSQPPMPVLNKPSNDESPRPIIAEVNEESELVDEEQYLKVEHEHVGDETQQPKNDDDDNTNKQENEEHEQEHEHEQEKEKLESNEEDQQEQEQEQEEEAEKKPKKKRQRQLPEPTPLQTEAEAFRQHYISHIIKQPDMETLSPALRRRSVLAQKAFVLSHFTADFGSVVVGTSKKKTFRVTNTSMQPLSLEIDSVTLMSHGFTVEPAKVSRLPSTESVDFTIRFRCGKKQQLGPLTVNVPLAVKNGPKCDVTFKANVTVPDVTLTTDNIDFKHVPIGHCRIFTVQLHNSTPVTAEWNCLPPAGLSGQAAKRVLKDVSAFKIHPISGSLAPGMRTNVEVTFIPTESRICKYKIPVNVNLNPQIRYISCKGIGSSVKFSFEPAAVELGPVMPNGEEPALTRVEAVNDGDQPIELISLEFDKRYVEEERVLSMMPGYDNESVLRLPPRDAGGPLPEPFASFEAKERRTQTEQNIQNKIETLKNADDSDPSEITSLEEQLSQMQKDEELRMASDYAHPELWSKDDAPRLQGKSLNIVVHGPRLSGKSTQAKLISEKMGFACLTVDDVVEWCIEHNSPQISDEINKLIEEVESIQADVQPSKKKKGNKSSVPETPPPMPTLPITLLARCIQERMKKIDCSCGVVIDSLDSKYSSPQDISQALSIAFDEDNYYSNKPKTTTTAATTTDDDDDGNNEIHNNSGGLYVLVLGFERDSLMQRIEDLKEENAESEDIELMNRLNDEQVLSDSINLYYESVDAILGGFNKSETTKDTSLIEIDGTDETEVVFAAINVELPEAPIPAPIDPSTLPPPAPVTWQMIHKPTKRANIDTSKEFSIVQNEESVSGSLYRWIIPSKSRIPLTISFASKEVGNFRRIFNFEIVGSQRSFSLPVFGVCSVPKISDNPRNTFMRRMKSKRPGVRIAKKFIMNDNIFDFGALLVNKSASDAMKACKSAKQPPMVFASQCPNLEVCRLTNNGLFEANVSLSARPMPANGESYNTSSSSSSSSSPDDENAKDKSSKEKRRSSVTEGGGITLSTTFHVEPSNLTLAPNETKEIELWCCPQSVGRDTAQLVCDIEDNPNNVVWDLACVGAKPQLKLDGEWDSPPEPVEVPSGKKGKKPKAPSSSGCSNLINFDKLLLSRHESKQFSVVNPGDIPISWKLALGDLEKVAQAGVFSIQPLQGSLQPHESTKVTITFSALEEAIYDSTLVISYSDIEAGSSTYPQQNVEVRVMAEAYKVNSLVSIGEESNGELDFGSIRCFEVAERSFKVENLGKYGIDFNVVIQPRSSNNNRRRRGGRTSALSSNGDSSPPLQITPTGGSLDPGQQQIIEIKFSPENEIYLKDNKDVRCLVREPSVSDSVEDNPIRIQARAVFTRCRLQPHKGISFGALLKRQQRSRNFELQNQGDFPISFSIMEHTQENIDSLTDKTWSFNPSVSSGSLVMGPFTIEQCGGVIEPGENAAITAVFEAPDGTEIHRKRVIVVVSGLSPDEGPLMYDLMGESCEPGINTTDFMEIFEEQTVAPTLQDREPGSEGSIFGSEERVFHFGSVVPSVKPQGVTQRIKISNPFKVGASLALRIEGDEAFVAQPREIEVPAHEHRYVELCFRPINMREHSATFIAEVSDAGDPNTGSLKFELRGEGTLPSVSVVKPALVAPPPPAKGQPAMPAKLIVDFPKLQLDKKAADEVSLKNVGVVPATVSFKLDGHTGAFSCPLAGSAVTIQPGASFNIPVAFCPTSRHMRTNVGEEIEGETSKFIRKFTDILTVAVKQNEFEKFSIELCGIGYLEDVSLIIPGDDRSVLNFGERDLSSSDPGQQVQFSLKSHADDLTRYVFTEHDDFKFSPSIGHLPPGGSVDIMATFLPSSGEAVRYEELPIEVSIQSIEITPSEAEEEASEVPEGSPRSINKLPIFSTSTWNNALSSQMDFSPRGEDGGEVNEDTIAADNDNEKLNEDGIEGGPSITCEPEPAFDEKTEPKPLPFFVSAAADSAKYECSVSDIIRFHPTMMFQSRLVKFSLTNNAKSHLEYGWIVENMNKDAPLLNDFAATMKTVNHCPFSIVDSKQSNSGVIAPESSEEFTVRFAPVEIDVNEYCYMAKCNMPSMSPNSDMKPLEIRLTGRAQRPLVHFNLENKTSTIATESLIKRNLSPRDIRVLEFDAVGLDMKHTKRFQVVNPTGSSYEFEWSSENVNIGETPAFRCVTPRGLMLPGKRVEMIFEFTPRHMQNFEQIITFHIPQHNISQKFYLFGSVREPRVSFLKGNVNFREVLVNRQTVQSVTLRNEERVPFSFRFASPPAVEGHQPVVVIPSSGIIPPHGETQLQVKFEPIEEKPHNVNILCHVQNKFAPLHLNIKGEAYALHDRLELIQELKQDVETAPSRPGTSLERPSSADRAGNSALARGLPLSRENINRLDFGHIHVNQLARKEIVLHNDGKFAFDFEWQLQNSEGSGLRPTSVAAAFEALPILVSPLKGSVPRGGRVICAVEFHPQHGESVLNDQSLSCVVAGSRVYHLVASGEGRKPAADFSFKEYDFGTCFVGPDGDTTRSETVTTTLQITNNEEDHDLCIEYTPPRIENSKGPIVVDFDSVILKPGDIASVPISFTPSVVGNVHEMLVFDVNGCHNVSVSVTGEGTQADVRLAEGFQKKLNLGAIAVGQSLKRKIKVVNHSRKSVSCQLMNELQVAAHLGREAPSSLFAGSDSPWKDNQLTISRGSSTIAPRGTGIFELSFTAHQRIEPFSEELYLLINSDSGVPAPPTSLLTVVGGCQGVDVRLETDQLAFGAVVSGSVLTKRLLMENIGELPTRYSWRPTASFDANFSIEPQTGFLGPNAKQVFEVAFRPTNCGDVSGESLDCILEGHVPVSITVMGTGAPQPESQTSTLEFRSPVRGSHSLNVTLPKNETSNTWRCSPSISHSAWQLDEETLDITPGESRTVPIHYRPVKSTNGRPDIGELFVALPNGSALLCKLSGETDEPEPATKIEKTIIAKKPAMMEMVVSNWLTRQSQRFSVQHETDGGDLVTLTGPKVIDIAAGAKRTYKLNCFAYKPGTVSGKTVFLTDKGEYLEIPFTLSVQPAELLDTLTLTTAVRRSLTRLIYVENPLPTGKTTSFNVECNEATLSVKQIEAQTTKQYTFEVTYLPLLETGDKPKEVSLAIKSNDLGTHSYKLLLNATSASLERSLHFNAALGTTQSQIFRFQSLCPSKVEYTCKVDHPSFTVVPKVSADPCPTGSEPLPTNVEVLFDPSKIGSASAVLKLESPVGGVFTCGLSGECGLPRPRGPFEVQFGGQTPIEFRNPLPSSQEFVLHVDNSLFSLPGSSIKVDSRKTQNIAVKCGAPPKDDTTEAHCRLMVTPKDDSSGVSWTFYIKACANPASGSSGSSAGKKKGKKK